MTPVFRSKDKQEKTNYRPISLLPAFSKILERIVFKSLFAFCQKNNLLTWRNSGYKPLDSSINQLINISHKIYKSLENGQDMCLVAIDATAAFDKVCHDGLIHKLKCKGVGGQLLNWFMSYLTDRKQRVIINGQHSNWAQIHAGVPQGSILGPLLFIIYIDDIIENIESNIFLFADDTSLLESITDPLLSFAKLNRDLSKLNEWAKQWLVTFNPLKTKYIIFSKKIEQLHYPDLY